MDVWSLLPTPIAAFFEWSLSLFAIYLVYSVVHAWLKG